MLRLLTLLGTLLYVHADAENMTFGSEPEEANITSPGRFEIFVDDTASMFDMGLYGDSSTGRSPSQPLPLYANDTLQIADVLLEPGNARSLSSDATNASLWMDSAVVSRSGESLAGLQPLPAHSGLEVPSPSDSNASQWADLDVVSGYEDVLPEPRSQHAGSTEEWHEGAASAGAVVVILRICPRVVAFTAACVYIFLVASQLKGLLHDFSPKEPLADFQAPPRAYSKCNPQDALGSSKGAAGRRTRRAAQQWCQMRAPLPLPLPAIASSHS